MVIENNVDRRPGKLIVCELEMAIFIPFTIDYDLSIKNGDLPIFSIVTWQFTRG